MTKLLRSGTRLIAAIIVVLVSYLLLTYLLVPHLIRSAYAGESLPILNGLIRGQDTLGVDAYLASFDRVRNISHLILIGSGLAIAIARIYSDSLRRGWNGLIAALPRTNERDVLIFALGFGLVAGLAEAGRVQVWYRIRHISAGQTVAGEVVWMAPLAAAMAFLFLAFMLIAASRLPRAHRFALGIAPFLFGAWAIYGFTRSLALGLEPWAVAVLSFGASAMITRGIREHLGAVRQWASRTCLIGGIGLLCWAVSLPLLRQGVTQWRTGQLAEATGSAPNVIVIVWDTVRGLSLSLYGRDRLTTPNLEKLALESAVFERATASAPWTLPSHASMFTGVFAYEHGARHDRPLDSRLPTLAEVLRARGYQTSGFIANEYFMGPAFGLSRGFDHYRYWKVPSVLGVLAAWWPTRRMLDPWEPKLDLVIPTRISAEEINGSFVEWLDQRDVDRPFFSFLNYIDAHDPYQLPRGAEPEFGGRDGLHRWKFPTADYSGSELEQLRDAYESGIFYLDQHLGALLQELRDRELLENTIIVLTSDHGETLGEHGSQLLGHWTSIHYDVLQVPLVVRAPGQVESGRRIQSPVSLVELPATIMDLVAPGDTTHPFPGRSLFAPHDAGSPSRPIFGYSEPGDWHRDVPNWPISRGPLKSLIDGRFHYISNEDGEEQLFDVVADPWETRDLAVLPDQAVRLRRYRAELALLAGERSLPGG